MQPHSSRSCCLEVAPAGATTIVRLPGPVLVEQEAIDAVARRLLEAAEQSDSRSLVVNCSAVQEFSSALLGKLVWLRKRILSGGGRLILCALPAHLVEVLQRLQIASLFTLCGDEQEALGLLAG